MFCLVKLIVAQSLNGVIGVGGKLPWHLAYDMAFFRNQTMGHTVVMGRKTYESIGKALPGRRNFVLTRDSQFVAPGVEVFRSVEEVLRLPLDEDQHLFVIGGQSVYEAFLPCADEIFLTLVVTVLDGDRFFPRITGDWDCRRIGWHAADKNNDFEHHIFHLRRVQSHVENNERGKHDVS